MSDSKSDPKDGSVKAVKKKRVRILNSVGGLMRTMKIGSYVVVNDDLKIQFVGWNGSYAKIAFKGDKSRYSFRFEHAPEGTNIVEEEKEFPQKK